jgi:hypothetical protein
MQHGISASSFELNKTLSSGGMMRTNSPAFFDMDFGKAVLSFPGVDVASLLASERRNFEAFMRASRCIADGTLLLAKRQVDIVGQAMEGVSAAIDQLTKSDAPDVRLAKFTELAGVSGGKALTNAHELSDLGVRTITQTCIVINRRVLEAVEEFHEFAFNVAKSSGETREALNSSAVPPNTLEIAPVSAPASLEAADASELAVPEAEPGTAWLAGATAPTRSAQPPFDAAAGEPANAAVSNEANVDVPPTPKQAIEPGERLATKSIPSAKHRGKKLPKRGP